jgi:drug/metabolite transporter (DMT)-like permease
VGALFGSEHFNLRDLAGGLLVIAGMWLSLQRGRVPLDTALEAAA